MLKKKGEANITQLKAEKRSSNVVIVGLLISNFSLAGVLGYAVMNRTVVVMPSVQTGKYIVGSDQANKEYFIDTSRDIISLLYNVTPVNVDENFSKLLERVLPENQKDIKPYLDEAADRIKKQQITQVWSTNGLYQYFPNEKAIIANGLSKTYLADKLVTAKPQKLKIVYAMKDGQLFPKSIKEVVENESN